MYTVKTDSGIECKFSQSYEAHSEAERLMAEAGKLAVPYRVTVHDDDGKLLRSYIRTGGE